MLLDVMMGKTGAYSVAGDEDQLGLAGAQALKGGLVTQDNLAGLHNKRKLAVDAVGIGLVLLGGHCEGGCRNEAGVLGWITVSGDWAVVVKSSSKRKEADTEWGAKVANAVSSSPNCCLFPIGCCKEVGKNVDFLPNPKSPTMSRPARRWLLHAC